MRELKVLEQLFVEVEYHYPNEVILPGTSGQESRYYLVRVEKFTKATVEEALMKFGVDAAKNLPFADQIKVLSIRAKRVKETPLN